MINIYNVIAIDFHAKGFGTACDGFADISNTDHSKSTLTQTLPGDLFPFAGFHFFIHPGSAAGKGEHVSKDGIGNRRGKRIQGAPDFD